MKAKPKSKKKAAKAKEKPLKLNGTFDDFMKAAMGRELKEPKKG